LEATDRLEHSGPVGDAPPPRRHPYRGFVLRVAGGLALVVFLIRRAGGVRILSVLARERPLYFIAAAALYLAGLVVQVFRWRMLAAIVSIRAPFSEFFAYYFVGAFTNLFVPGLVGGDVARALYLGRKHDRLGQAAASAIADRLIGIMALFWLGAAGASWAARDGTLPATVTTPVILIGLASFVVYLAGPLIAGLEQLMPHRLARLAGLMTPFMRRPTALIPAIILSLLLQFEIVLGQYVMSLGLGLSIPFSLFLLCVPIANAFASIPITIGGLGLREGAYVKLFGMAGVASTNAVALGLLSFSMAVIGGLAGAIPFITTPIPPLRAPKATETPSAP
jgi:glycosyltransferase 2 family protein